MMDGLKDVHRTAIVDLLRANGRVERAVLFGSRATETFTPASDVDIALFGEVLTTADQARLAAGMEELAVPQRVDLLLYDRIEDTALREHIHRDGIEVYRRQQGVSAGRLSVPEMHCRTLASILREHLPGVEVWACGSRVVGRGHDGSGLDLVLRGPELKEIPTVQLADFEEAVREASIPFPVQARDWTQLPERFHREIERQHVVVLESTVGNEPSSTWSTATIGDISERVAMGPFGSSIRVATFVPSGVPIISGQHLHGTRVDDSPGHSFITDDHAQRLSNSNVQRGDIVLTHAGNIGQVAYIPENSRYGRYVISQRQFCLRCDRAKANPEFITYFFKSPEGQHNLLANASQVGVPSIAQPVTYLRTIEVPLPPLSEQRAIARILGTLDDKIELNRRINETLEAMARAVFKDWFVDFGPTRAKAEGREPYLAPELWDLFPDALDDEGKPAGWSLATLTALADLNPESWTRKNCPEEVEYVDLANTKWGRIEATQRYGWQDAPSRAKRVLRPGDTIVGMVRPGNGSFAFIDDSGLTGSTGFAVLRPLERPYRTLVYLSATAPENIQRLANLADGAAYPAVRPEVVGGTEIAVPDDAVTSTFSALLSPILDQMASNKREDNTLAQARDLLLPKLMSGEIRLGDAEKVIEAVA